MLSYKAWAQKWYLYYSDWAYNSSTGGYTITLGTYYNWYYHIYMPYYYGYDYIYDNKYPNYNYYYNNYDGKPG